ncbi:MAG: NAD(P)-dependent oxidoreductase [Candidatus Brocadiia bacterium]
MERPRIYIHRVQWCPYDRYMDEENERLLASFAEVTNHGGLEEAPSREELVEALTGVHGILSLNGSCAGEITPEILTEARTVEVASVSHWWGQHNEVAPAWESAGVQVIDASDACNEAVAEWTVGAAIAGLRKFDAYDRQMKSGVEWPSFHEASQLNGSTVGLVALGRVGRIVARYLGVFDCRVLAFDPGVSEEEAVALGVELVDLDTLLSTADVVSLHAPVTEQTTGMIGERELSLLKDGALLLNCARAALTDGKALREELATGRIRAYMDVYEPEPPPLDDPLREIDNVVMTPHVAGTTDLMFKRCGRFAIEALRDYFAGRQ